MQADWSYCTFYRAENTSARIIAILLADNDVAVHRATAQNSDRLLKHLRKLGPECEKISAELKASQGLTRHELDEISARLRAELKRAEDKRPGPLGELEDYLFQPVCQDRILGEELDEIGLMRTARHSGPVPPEARNVRERARQSNLCGLALSGGGIRSATFNLGLLQGMAKHGVLPAIDYLSMVSGGGYIGGWLTAWIKREGFDKVKAALSDEQSDPRGDKLRPLAFLRDYASYLTPQTGLFSADTWTAFMTWSRNTFLNLIILLSGLSALLLIPRLVKSSQLGLQRWLTQRFESLHYPEELLTVMAIACLAIIIVHAGRNLREFKNPGQSEEHPNVIAGFGYTSARIQKWIIVPALFAAAFGSARLWGLAIELRHNRDGLFIHLLGLGAMVGACFVLLAYLQWRGGFVECYMREKRQSVGQRRKARFLCFFVPFLVSLVKAGLLFGVYELFSGILNSYPCHNPHAACTADSIAVTCGTPVLLTVFAICISVHMGLMGRNFPDDRREWWSRIAAYLGIYAAAISAIFAVALFGKNLLADLTRIPGGWISPVCGWALTTAGGLLFARHSPKDKEKGSSEKEKKSTIAINGFLALSPLVFVAGLFVVLSTALDSLLQWTEQFLSQPVLGRLPATTDSSVSNPLVVLFYVAVLLVIMFSFASTVDINEFSMHHFYRNRLIRAYLGASNSTTRRPNRLTGFDSTDDLPMASLRPECEPGFQNDKLPYTGPYPIFNAALNLVHGDRLSWQERKATSFVFTPKFCGYDFQAMEDVPVEPPLRNAGFRPTSVYAYPDGGVHLGTAMAISGAALSPNSGARTSTALAFLLTVFNVRLGWWMGNPRNDRSWQSAGPRFGLVYLIYELFGWTNDRQKQVYLSDGGHFDNLGIYELVRRRCSLIIASDAEEDGECSFHGLGGVIRKCFIDFGVRIDISLNAIRHKEGSSSEEHFAVGHVHYPEGWSGTLLYIKSSLTGDEPADLNEYTARRQAFPNQATADQFFDESQFESYHRLGLHIAKGAFGPDATEEATAAMEKIRQRMWSEDDRRDTPFFFDRVYAAAGD